MKKFLLSCCLALGIGASAQYSYTGDFEDPGYSTTLYGQFGGGTRTAGAACAGAFGGQLALSASVTSTGYMVILNQLTTQTNNGQQATVTANYKKGAGIVGNITLAYFVRDDASGSYNIIPFGTTVSLATAAITTCATLTGTVPAGALQPGKTNAIGVWVTRTSGTGNVFTDNISIAQDVVTTVPACTTFTNPANGSTVSGGNYAFTWPTVATAVNYKVTVGTTPGASDIINTVASGNSLNVSLPTASTFYAKVVPTNLVGDAAGCSEITFNTDANISYCGPLTTNQAAAVAPIKSVNFAGTTNTSDPTVTTLGAFSPYQDFTAGPTFTFAKGIASVPLTIQGITNGGTNNGWGMSVFIDWNNDGDFDDAGESYFNTTASMIRIAGVTANPVTLTGNIAVPSGVTVGTKRMRIKYNFTGTAIHEALTTGCSQMGNGQAEDYSLIVTPEPTVAPTCTTVITPANAATGIVPNPTVITWGFVGTATSYKVYIGTTAGGSDIANGVVVAGTSYSTSLAPNTLFYVRVIASNAIGDATGCTETSFTTTGVVYCTAGATTTSLEKISNVKLKEIDNPSTSTAGYENFTTVSPALLRRDGSYPINVSISAFDSDETIVWIDYNQDGTFDDSEKTVLSIAAIATGSIVVPASAKLGDTRMRVRMHYASLGGNATSCGTSTYGQVEDYTVNIDVSLAAVTTNKNTVALYPNPFTDVLKISDIKGVKSVTFSDVSGRQVKSVNAASDIQVSDLKTGLYIVTLHMEDGTVKSIKAIKK